jgi:SnoaL-like domain
VEGSPLTQLLEAMDRLDVEATVSTLAPSVQMLAADGRRANGHDEVARLLDSFLGELRRMEHRVTAQWHVDDVWIAEVDGTYELRDYFQTGALPRVFIARAQADGISELRVYGAHERPLTDHTTGEEGMWVGGRWIPPL